MLKVARPHPIRRRGEQDGSAGQSNKTILAGILWRHTPLIAPYPDHEAQRVEALKRYEILDTEPEAPFDELVQLAAQICQVPIALISLIDPLRQWFKAKTGVAACHTSRDIAFCAHAILQRDMFEVPDALGDVRFATNPLVTGEPHIRFYAGVPLIDREGHALGTLCVIDRVPKRLSAQDKQALTVLGRQVVAQFELRLRHRQLAIHVAKLEQADSLRSTFLFAAEQALDGIAFLDETGRYTYMNHAHAAQYGYEPTALIGKSWRELYTAAEIAKIDTMAFPLLKEQGRWQGETIGRGRDGAPITTQVSLALFPDQERRSDWLLWISRKRLLITVENTLRSPECARPAQQPMPDRSAPSDPYPLHILLVEDMEDNRVLITLLLKALPYRLDLAENGAVGVKKFQAGQYDLVLMDVQMPVMDGYEAVHSIRAWEAEQGRDATPIIALTGNGLTEDIEKAQAVGFTAHLTKPIKKHTLLEAIQQHAIVRTKEAAL